MALLPSRVPRRLTVQYSLPRIFRINFSRMSNCEQTAVYLLGMLMLRPAFCPRREGDNIVTCGVARLSQDLFRVDLAFCCECDSGDLEVCYTSKALGPHLCPTCAWSKVGCRKQKETQTLSPMRGQTVA